MRPVNKVAVAGSSAGHLTFYVEVPDLEEALRRSRTSGAKLGDRAPQVRLPMRCHAHYNAVTPQPPLSYAKSCSYNP